MSPKAILKDLLTPDPFVSHADIWQQVSKQILNASTRHPLVGVFEIEKVRPCNFI